MGFVKVASNEEVPAGKMKLVEAKGTAVLLANIAGEYYAIGNKCTHRSCKLSSGTLEGEIVKCPCHGSKFNVKTGEVVHGPAAKPEPKYTVKVEKDQILIDA
jgi:3-phenylpropionate/trans-cinnamate dioxygenase ferredoxin component